MRLPKLVSLSLALSTTAFAQGVQIVGTIDQVLNTPQKHSIHAYVKPHKIKLMKMHLSPEAQQTLGTRTRIALHDPKPSMTAPNLPHSIQLGMNEVPVLDQGNFGSCVTFAATAAVDAALGKGDYISQLCQLQLGLYLEQNAYTPSGWMGSWGRTVLSQMENFGIVNKDNQKDYGCGGLTQYPKNDIPSPDTAMTPDVFHKLSENLEEAPVLFSTVLDGYQALLDRTDTNQTINHIKTALNEHDRVIFAVLLLDFDLGTMGAVGTHNTQFDSWVLTPEIARDIYLNPNFGGHEMIITGYDDDAVAIDDHGQPHKGLFTLRNSWGEQAGDKGNFYMSYDYFKVLVYEAQRIRTLPSENDNPEITTA